MRILIIDDDPDIQALLRRLVQDEGAGVESAVDGDAGIHALANGTFDVVLLDLMLPKISGFEVAKAIERMRPQPRMIIVSALARHFLDRFPPGTVLLQKPFEVDRLPAILRELAGGSRVRVGSATDRASGLDDLGDIKDMNCQWRIDEPRQRRRSDGS